MGEVIHRMVTVTYNSDTSLPIPDIEKFRSELHEDFKNLLVGPTPLPINNYCTVILLPCGSKVNWIDDDNHIEACLKLARLFEGMRHDDGSTPATVIMIEWYDDDCSININKLM